MRLKRIRSKILQVITVLLGVSFLTFLLTFLAPGDPVTAMYEASGTIPTPEMIETARKSMGLDKPFIVQYTTWLANCLKGDFGTSLLKHSTVLSIIMERLVPTIKLAFLSLGIMLITSIPAGIISAVKKDKFSDYFIRGINFIGVSMPGFWIGLMLLYVFALKLNLLPVVSNANGVVQMILPAITLAISMSAKYTRQVRTAVLEELNQDYVTGARARGIKESVILFKHVIPNAMLPLITLLGLSLGSLLGGTAVVEVIFSYQGLGNLVVSAVSTRDYPLIQGIVLWIAMIYMFVNILVDISYGFLDPRIREER